MKLTLTPLSLRKLPLALSLIVAALFAAPSLTAQTNAVAPRITQRIDDSQRTVLHGNTLRMAQPKYDQGPVDPSTPTNRMLLVLKRSDAQEIELQKLIADMHNPASPSFHKWLKPAEFGQRFGVADSDVETVKGWLQAKGFSINKVNQGKTVIDINGTAGMLKRAFHTELHTYVRNGVTFHANNKDPEIPTALAGVVAGFASLNDIRPKSEMKVMGTATYDPKTNRAQPQWTYPDGGGYISLVPAPADMAVQYNIAPVYKAGTTGAGENIGILSASNVDVSIVQNYRTLFSLGSPTNLPQVVVDGIDPGQNGAATEAYLDVEASGSMAPDATVYLYVAADTNTTSGLYSAIIRAVDDDVADVMSLSYGTCEQDLGTGNEFFYEAWQQAAAQGQSAFVSAGDGGSAGCDDFDTESAAQDGLAISGFASTPYNTAVGGTDFYYSDYANSDLNTQLAQYWDMTATNSPAVSILATIPEQPWNNSLGLNIEGNGYGIVAGSGGASSCVTGVYDPGTGGYDTCTAGYPKPTWQKGTGVPADSVRDIPDVSLFAANGVNVSYWPICVAGTDCVAAFGVSGGPVNITGVGGTSASSPATAGIMALIDQSQKSRQGVANVGFYAVAAADSTAFNDVTNGSNNVICVQGSLDCSASVDSEGYYDLGEYPATTGYDQASGLGTPNVDQIIKDWGKLKFTSTTTTLALTPASVAHGAAITAKTSVTGSGGTPSGDVALVLSDSAPNAKGQGVIALANGTGSEPVTLPGGKYSVYGVYSGDGTFAASESSPVEVTVTPESSTTTLLATYFDNEGDENTLTSGVTSYYGYLYAIDADIAGASGTGAASGLVTYYDGSTSIGVGTANSSGVAELDLSNFAPGSHSITAKYAGDSSFNASTSAAVTFTVAQGVPTLYLDDTYDYTGISPIAGQAFSIPVQVVGNAFPWDYYYGLTLAQPAAPSGTITVTFGTQTQTLNLTPAASYFGNYGAATATFTPATAGTDALTVTYSGDANYAGTGTSESIPVVAATLAASTTTVSLASGYPAPAANTGVVVNLTVAPASGTTPVPTGYVIVYIDGECLEGYYGCNEYQLSSTGTVTGLLIPSDDFATGANAVTAQYLGDGNYSGSNSAGLAVSINAGDFTLIVSNPLVTLAKGTASTTLYVASLQGLTGAVNFTCATPIASLYCSLSPTSVTLTADSAQYSTTMTVTTIKPASAALDKRMRLWMAGGGITMAMLFVGFPARRRSAWKTRGGVLFALLLMLGIGFGISGCGSSSVTGTYPVVVTATGSGVVHQTTVNVVIP